ncbi:MAG: SPL family radical SAM protein [bacterium]
MEIKEVEITQILNPTSIDLGDYVINPFRGCALSCLYCYVRHNKVTQRDKRQWGDYVDIRVNAPMLLEKELVKKRPTRVLLGSTTECFQPVEEKWHMTEKILGILNRHKVLYTILTRSPSVLNAIPLLKEGFCEAIYFTINHFNDTLKKTLEPKSASFNRRMETIQKLLQEDIPVIPYFSPVLPYISDFSDVFSQCKNSRIIEFEGLNFSLGNIKGIIESIGTIHPQLKEIYQNMLIDRKTYQQIFNNTQKEIKKQAIKTNTKHRIFIHKWRSYFENTYAQGIK